MAEYLLQRWEAIELFSEMISKAEGKDSPIGDFIINNRKIRNRLNTLKEKEGSEKFSIKYFRPRRNTKQEDVPDKIDLMSFLSQNILIGIPFLIDQKELEYIINFIDGDNSDRLTNYSKYFDRGIDSISDKQRTFEQTDWWLYYHSQLEDEPKLEVISKAVLSLLPFGRAKITRPLLPDEKSTDQIQVYIGTFSVYGRSNDLLKLSFKTDKHDRDLNILLYVGDTVPPVAIGAYNNHYINMNCGAVYLERIEEEDIKKVVREDKAATLIKFTTTEDPNFENVRLVVRDFLMKNKRYFHVAKGKNSISKVIEWLSDEGRFEE